ncbi:MAG: glycosyltransferase family 4 protein [Thermogutta sp.]|nr:glycosyltransferase family 4 protein [Thermogutta sp.]
MRILHFNEHLSWAGGVETYLLHLIPRLAAQGIEQHYAFAQGDASLWPNSIPLPELAGFGRRAEAAGYARTQRLLRDLRPDVIHIHRVYNLGVIQACLENGPVVVTCHDYLYLCPAASFFHRRTQTICRRRAGPACFAVTLFKHCLTPRPRFAAAYYRRVRTFVRWKDRFAAVLCPSESVRERLLAHAFPAEKAITLPYFCPVSPRAEPRPLPSTPTLLFLGRIRPIKGYDVFIRCLGLIPNARGLMVGDLTPESSRRVTDTARTAGCEDRLTLRGWASREEITALFEAASVFVFPSIWPETLGIVGLEAMARGVPVVAADVGGVRQWLKDGENGFLVPPKDAAATAAAARRLLESPQLMLRMGKAAIETIQNGFLPEQHIARLVEVYHSRARHVEAAETPV